MKQKEMLRYFDEKILKLENDVEEIQKEIKNKNKEVEMLKIDTNNFDVKKVNKQRKIWAWSSISAFVVTVITMASGVMLAISGLSVGIWVMMSSICGAILSGVFSAFEKSSRIKIEDNAKQICDLKNQECQIQELVDLKQTKQEELEKLKSIKEKLETTQRKTKKKTKVATIKNVNEEENANVLK